MEIWVALTGWLRELDPAFAFLLALPFVIGALGLLAHRPSRKERHAEQRAHGAARVHAR